MDMKVRWFTVKLGLRNVSEKAEAPNAVELLRDELFMRPHLKNPSVSWENPSASWHESSNRLIVQASIEGLRHDMAAGGFADEVMGIVVALFVDPTNIPIEILSVVEEYPLWDN